MFIYAVISFLLLHNRFVPSNDDQLFCTTLFECTWSVLRYGLLDNIGLVKKYSSLEIFCSLGSMIILNIYFFVKQIIPLDENERTTFSNTYILRLVYDLSFFIIVTTIGLNVVFGIIVDAFGELRDEKV